MASIIGSTLQKNNAGKRNRQQVNNAPESVDLQVLVDLRAVLESMSSVPTIQAAAIRGEIGTQAGREHAGVLRINISNHRAGLVCVYEVVLDVVFNILLFAAIVSWVDDISCNFLLYSLGKHLARKPQSPTITDKTHHYTYVNSLKNQDGSQ